MPGLPRQLISVPLAGLNTKADPKGAPIGLLSQVENAYAARRTVGGIELRKRNGFSSLTRNIQGSGFIAAGVMGAAFGDEIVVCDGLRAYSYAATLAKWVLKGRTQAIAADLTNISGSLGDAKHDADGAYSGGYYCSVASRPAVGSSLILVRDEATGEIVARHWSSTTTAKARVLADTSAFYICTWNNAAKLQVRRILLSDVTTISVLQDVATDLKSTGVFDVTYDALNTRIWVAYANNADTLTVKTWTLGGTMAVGLSATYASIEPKFCVGWLKHDFSGGSCYLGVGANVGGVCQVRALTINTSDATVSANVLLEASSFTARQITGYYQTALNLLWTEDQSSDPTTDPGYQVQIRAYNGAGAGTLFSPLHGWALGSRAFAIGSKWYVVASYQTDPLQEPAMEGFQRRTILFELDAGTTGGGGTMQMAGYLLAQESPGHILGDSCLPSVPTTSSTRALLPVVARRGPPPSLGANVTDQHYHLSAISLDWSGAGLGRPVMHNGVLHIPGAIQRIYDGASVFEAGYVVNPEAPADIAGTGTGGEFSGVYQYCLVFARIDRPGREWLSAPGPVATFDATGSDFASLEMNLLGLTATDTDEAFNTDPNVATTVVRVYRTKKGLPVFYLAAVLPNDPGQTIAFTDSLTDAELELNEILYTSGGELDNFAPTMVKVLQPHAGRLLALTGDGSTWVSKLTAEGYGTEWSDDLRVLVDDAGGAPVGLGSLDSVALVFKRNRTYVIGGSGPDDQGNNPYPPPQALTADLGAVSANATLLTQEGILVQTAKGRFLLDRSLTYQAVEGVESWDSLTMTGGVSLDDQSLAVITTSDRMLVRDWQLGQWYTWAMAGSGLAAVAAFRWRNKLCILQADGTVKQQVAAQYFDGTSTEIDMRVEVAWINLQNAIIDEIQVRGDVLASCTLAGTFSYDLDPLDTETKSVALTTTSKQPAVFPPNRDRVESLRMLFHVSSITEGLRLTSIDLVVGLRRGPAAHRDAQFAT